MESNIMDALSHGMKKATLTGGEKILAHDPEKCAGEVCCIHNPSDHHMRKMRQHWRGDRGIMERLCSHGIGHPDPDDPTDDTVHGCDGCCRPPLPPVPDRRAAIEHTKRKG
jgi:hypothetical protein